MISDHIHKGPTVCYGIPGATVMSYEHKQNTCIFYVVIYPLLVQHLPLLIAMNCCVHRAPVEIVRGLTEDWRSFWRLAAEVGGIWWQVEELRVMAWLREKWELVGWRYGIRHNRVSIKTSNTNCCWPQSIAQPSIFPHEISPLGIFLACVCAFVSLVRFQLRLSPQSINIIIVLVVVAKRWGTKNTVGIHEQTYLIPRTSNRIRATSIKWINQISTSFGIKNETTIYYSSSKAVVSSSGVLQHVTREKFGDFHV